MSQAEKPAENAKPAENIKPETNNPISDPSPPQKREKNFVKKESSSSFLEEFENHQRKRTFTFVKKQECWNRVLIKKIYQNECFFHLLITKGTNHVGEKS